MVDFICYPQVIEFDDHWSLSFNGHNPEINECIDLPEKDCWFLKEQIDKLIDLNITTTKRTN